MTPPSISPGYRHNFELLHKAAKHHDLCLVSAIRKADQRPVALVCAMNRDANGNYCPAPIAVMIEGNPFELFEDPTVTRDDTDAAAAVAGDAS